MIKPVDQHVSKFALAILLTGCISMAHPAYAVDASVAAKPAAAKQESAQDRVEARIKTLHDKLNVTSEQEPQWAAVADVMRSNEASLHKLAEARHENEAASAVDDLKSYGKIADAHAEGLKNLIPVFETFYNGLSDKQKKNADEIFGQFEGHEGHKDNAATAPKDAK